MRTICTRDEVMGELRQPLSVGSEEESGTWSKPLRTPRERWMRRRGSSQGQCSSQRVGGNQKDMAPWKLKEASTKKVEGTFDRANLC